MNVLSAEQISGTEWRVVIYDGFDEEGEPKIVKTQKVFTKPGATEADAIATFEDTKKPPSDAEITATKAQAAKSRVRAASDRAAAKIVKKPPDHEMTAWGTKADAATAYLAGTATARQIELIEIEANITGETVTELAETINAGATSKMDAVARLTGLRRVADAAIEADPTTAHEAAAAFEAAVAATIS